MSSVVVRDDMKILDIGCGIDGRSFSDFAPESWEIIGIDIKEPAFIKHSHKNFRYTQQSAESLPFADKSFDLVISIGMLEHVLPEHLYQSICTEIIRVGRQWIVVVPYRYGWIEPHYGFPFFGMLPQAIQIWLIKMFNLSGHRSRIDYFKENFVWRSNAQYLRDFPNSKIQVLPIGETIAILGPNCSSE